MGHKHPVYDSDTHFLINPTTRAIKNESSKKTALIQHDHNSERFTFEIPRYVDGHDMSVCDKAEIHYINVDATGSNQSADVYEVDDLQVSPDDSNVVICSWLISQNATMYAGSLNFIVRFVCLSDGVVSYAWHSAIHTDISVSSGILNDTEAIITPYVDVLAQWKADLFGVGDTQEQRLRDVSAAQQNAIQAKGAETLATIPEDYTGIAAKVNEFANAIKGHASGEIIRVDDVSPVEHNPVVKVYGKNLIPYPYSVETQTINGITYTDNGDGSFTLNGTSTANFAIVFSSKLNLVLDGIYTFSMGNMFDGAGGLYLKNAKGETVMFVAATNASKTEKVNDVVVRFDMWINSGHTFDNFTISPQLEKGETATEYTPYIAPETVTVTRCGKNILGYSEDFEINQNGLVVSYDAESRIFTINGTPDSASFSINFGSHLFDLFNIPVGTDVALSVEHISGTLTAESMTNVFYLGCSDTPGGGRNNWFSVPFPISGIKTNAVKATRNYFTRTWVYIGGENNVTFTNYKFRVQLEAGTEATAYEVFSGVKCTPSPNGTVSGLTSVAPTMTILTDKAGVNIECEYNVDTKTYIDNLVKGLMNNA